MEEVKIARIEKLSRKRGTYDILMMNPHNNFLLGNGILSKNSGKTFFMRGIADRFTKSGYACMFLFDVKNEFISSREPVQKKFQNMLLPDEEPQGQKVVALRPTFFKTIGEGGLPENNFWFSPNILEMSKTDFFTLFRADQLPPVQQVALDLLYERLRVELKRNPRMTFQGIVDLLETIEEIPKATQVSMGLKMRPLITSKFYEPEFIKDVPAVVARGWNVTVNMENFDHFSRSSYAYPDTTVSIILRRLIFERRRKKIPPIMIFCDEASRFIHNDRKTSFRDQMEESVDVDRRYGVSLCFAVQELPKFPGVILRQCRYVLVPYSANVQLIKETLDMIGVLGTQQNAGNEARRWKKRLRKFDWLVIDQMSGSFTIVQPLAPLSRHAETSS